MMHFYEISKTKKYLFHITQANNSIQDLSNTLANVFILLYQYMQNYTIVCLTMQDPYELISLQLVLLLLS